ncbi:efflux RND transporter periplasmic adaptor subunit [Aquicoccus sp.]|uniref:efflux RND transporter periplasmic adaptor subunit n=1 Tax=Aquicoccus sp. TaxID=2055851 RepID=UPI0035664CC1
MALWKQLLVLCVLVVLGYGGYEGYQRYFASEEAAPSQAGGGSRVAAVEAARAELRVLRDTVEAVGTTRARQSVEIVPETSGRIEELNFTPGQSVEKGDVLARLDDTIERANLAEIKARLQEHVQAVERSTQLKLSNAVAEATLEEAVARLAETRARIDRATQRLEDRTIRAPFAGIVGLAEVDEGARVAEGQSITRLDDLSAVVVEFSLPETLFARIRQGQTIKATSAAFEDRIFEGAIEAVDTRIDPVSRAFRTRAVIPNPEGVLPAGMFISLKLTLGQAEHVVVPEEAIIFQAAETYVFSVEEGVARRVTVETGVRREGEVAILSGLEEGAEVVVRGLHRVRDGSEVDVLEDTGSSDESEMTDEAES